MLELDLPLNGRSRKCQDLIPEAVVRHTSRGIFEMLLSEIGFIDLGVSKFVSLRIFVDVLKTVL